MNEMLNRLGMNAKAAETEMRNLSTNKKNEVLLAVADKLVKDAQTLINANRLSQRAGLKEWQRACARYQPWMILSGK